MPFPVAFRAARIAIWLASALFQLHLILGAHFERAGKRYYVLFDDAMISMRYARNFANGAGLVFDPGAAPVEGYSNLLWTLWMALPHALGVRDTHTSLFVMLSSMALCLATSRSSERLARALGGGEAAALGALASVALCYPLLYWSLRGMEVALLAWLSLVALLGALRAQRGEPVGLAARLALVAIPLVRADAAVPALVVAAAYPALAPRGARVRACAAALSAVALPILAQELFRWHMYDELLPNTYYLKLTGVALSTRLARGIETLWRHAAGELAPWLLAAAIALAARRRDPRVALVAALFACVCAYSVWAGGDAWEWMPYANRYVSAELPALAVLAALGAETAAGAARPLRVIAVALALLGASQGNAFWRCFRDGPAHAREERIVGALGVHLRETTKPNARIAFVWAGAAPYFSERPAIDLLGKSDARIARLPARSGEHAPGHDKWDYAYSIGELRPAVIESLWMASDEESRWVISIGYRQLRNGLFVDESQRDLVLPGIARVWSDELVVPGARSPGRDPERGAPP
jgi:hypothetical protein